VFFSTKVYQTYSDSLNAYSLKQGKVFTTRNSSLSITFLQIWWSSAYKATSEFYAYFHRAYSI